MTHDWVEVQIESVCDAGELLSLLDDPAVQGVWQEDGVIRLYWPAYAWSPDTLQELRGWLTRLDEAAPPDCIRIDRLPDRDWNELWCRSVQPLRIGRRVVVRPSWHPVTLQSNDVELVIDPKQAFGTGHHATTQLSVEWLEDEIHKDDRVLDVGTGSGILAMVALRLGAANAMGLDTDPAAIDCAREARLLFSGLLADQQAEVATAYAAHGASVGTVRERDGWVALELVATESCEGEVSVSSGRPSYPHVHQINVSDGGVPKYPVLEAVITVDGVQGDRQRNLKVHGGRDRAVCLFSFELIQSLQEEGHSIAPGSSGENLTLAGFAWASLVPGDRVRVGPDVQLEVTSYTAPCDLNACWFKNGDYKRISHKKHPGWSRLYAKVLREGLVRPGDVVTIEGSSQP